MKETYQFIWTAVGAILGLAVGVMAYFELFQVASASLSKGGAISVILALTLGLGGMMLGGYIAIIVTRKIDKNRRKQKAAEKKLLKRRRR